jgi:hypothetical protein
MPANWEVEKIGNRYLMIAEKSKPMLELKWGRVKGKFSHQSQLRRIADQNRKAIVKSVKKDPLPPDWKKALDGFEAAAFSWQSNTIGGFGAVLYCPTCKNATLIQFFLKDLDSIKHASRQLLRSFQDHRRDNQTIWSIFDIRAMIPSEFKLVHHRFEAGEFELSFANKTLKITLQRWGPASILLRNSNLAEFAKKVAHFSTPKTDSELKIGPTSVEWQISHPNSQWARLWYRIKPKFSYRCIRFWYLEEKNRILSVRIEGKTEIDPDFFNRICDAYESL